MAVPIRHIAAGAAGHEVRATARARARMTVTVMTVVVHDLLIQCGREEHDESERVVGRTG